MGGIRPRGPGGVVWLVVVVGLCFAAAAAAVAKLPAAPVALLVGAAIVAALAGPAATLARGEIERRGKDRTELRKGSAGARSLVMVRDLAARDLRVHAAVREDVDYVERDREPDVVKSIRLARRALIVGPSMSGKTRLALSAARTAVADYAFYEPADGKSLHELLARESGFDNVLVWLDDLERFVGAGGLTSADLVTLLDQQRVAVVATIRTSEYDKLQPTGEIKPPGWEVPAWFGEPIWLERWSEAEFDRLARTRTGSQVMAEARKYGLSGYLGGAPLVDRELRMGEAEHPAGYAVVRTAVDWRRAGIERPMPLSALEGVFGCYTKLRHAKALPDQVADGLGWALRPLNQTVALVTEEPDGYRALDLVMDKFAGAPAPAPELWATVLEAATDAECIEVGYRAYLLRQLPVARSAWESAAAAGHTTAMFALGVLLTELDPPELAAARGWYEQAAAKGHTAAMTNLGTLLADRLVPPELVAARGWWEQAAAAGVTHAMYNLGILLAERSDPPELVAARGWYEQAAAAGHMDAMFNLGVLLADRLDPPELVAARGWYERAAAKGHIDAMNNLGTLLADRLVPPELVAARGWYERAAAAGDIDAMNNLGTLLARLGPPELGSRL